MKYLIINRKNIKVTLSQNEIKNIFPEDNIVESKHNAVANLSALLNEISEKTSFVFRKNRLLIQLFESKSGGGEIFITCLSGKYKKFTAKKVFKIKKNKNLLIILDFNTLCKLSRRLLNDKAEMQADVLYYKNKYYLILKRINKSKKYPLYLSEYGKIRELSAEDELYLKEYCNVLSKENSLIVFAKL